MGVRTDRGAFLVISDLQIPFEKEGSLEFCKAIQKKYRIPDENIYNVGDELDQYFGGQWDKDPDMHHSPTSELLESKRKLKRWYRAFPKMKLCLSNHGSRWMRKALGSQIPSMLLRSYEDVIEAPETWIWQKNWFVEAPNHPFLIEHGDDYGSQMPHKQAVLLNNCSIAMGHHHSVFGVEFVRNIGQSYLASGLWGMVTGSLIDEEQLAFKYAKRAKHKPILGLGVVLDGGRTPILEPWS